MENILNFIQQIPPNYFLLGLFVFMLLTCMGLIPSHTDLTLLASAMLATNGKINFFVVLGVITLAILIGENLMFYIGRRLGERIFKLSFFSRIMPADKRETLRKGFVYYPNRYLLALRMSPVLRPYIYLTAGSMGLSATTFIKYHAKWTLTYILSIYTICFFGSELFIKNLSSPPLAAVIAGVILWFSIIAWVRNGITNKIKENESITNMTSQSC